MSATPKTTDLCDAREDVQACIAYGSEMARERFVEIPLEPVGA